MSDTHTQTFQTLSLIYAQGKENLNADLCWTEGF